AADHRAGPRQCPGRRAARGDRRRSGGSQGLPRGAGADMNGLMLESVSAGYGDTVVLEGISLDLSPGRTLAVLGRNGVGKTTLLATIMGHTRLRGGAIHFGGREISGFPAYRRARLGIGFVP